MRSNHKFLKGQNVSRELALRDLFKRKEEPQKMKRVNVTTRVRYGPHQARPTQPYMLRPSHVIPRSGSSPRGTNRRSDYLFIPFSKMIGRSGVCRAGTDVGGSRLHATDCDAC